MLQIEKRGGVTILRMEHGKVNAIDVEILMQLTEELENLKQSTLSALVLTGSGKVFSAGVDLRRVLKEDAEYLKTLLLKLSSTVEKLFLFPRPVIAALNGHTIAGGCILSCACDYRVMREGDFKIGVPELAVGVSYPTMALEALRSTVTHQRLEELVYLGRTYTPLEALQLGLVNEVVTEEALIDRACQLGQRLGEISPRAFALTKRQIRQAIIDRYQRSKEGFDKEILDIWCSPETHKRIQTYMEKTIRK